MTFRMQLTVLSLSLSVLLGVQACNDDESSSPTTPVVPADTNAPQLNRTVWQSGLTNPWDIAFLPDSTALITERVGRLRARKADGTLFTVATITDVLAVGEGGLLGLAIDPEFSTNRYVYLCLGSNLGGANDNRLTRFRLSLDLRQLTERTELVTGMPRASSGRHSGRRPRFGPDGYLWVGTGDAANGVNPQDLKSLGGKVLRITRDGAPAPDNPVIAGADPRIYTYGHRNVQGLAFQPGSGAAYSVEHGPSFDDEVTRLVAGANAGWNPVPSYNESVSMTDLSRYPNAMPAAWKSGSPARGTSGATFIRGSAWKGWESALVIAQLAGAKLVVLQFASDGRVAKTTNVFADQNTRLRVPVQGPDGALYIATDVGGTGGAIWRVSPK